jgi:hypothetical protein
MHYVFETLKNKKQPDKPVTLATLRAEEFRVVVPNAVVLPLTKAPRDEISVPASINGRDLSTGRL